MVWDREDYLKEAEKQLGDSEVYEELSKDPIGPLVKVVLYHLTNIKARGDVSCEVLDYFRVNRIISE